MPNRSHRPQRTDEVALEDTQPLVVSPLVAITDRLHNPKDIEVDTAAISHGIEHGGMQENQAAALNARGTGGRKRSGPFGRYRVGEDLSKRR